MKKGFRLCGFLIFGFLAIPNIQSQSIIGLEAGYGFPWAGGEISDGNIMSTGVEVVDVEVINWSFGAGRNYSISFSRFLNASIEAKCMVSYLDGSTVHRAVNFPNSSSISSYKTSAFWLSPTLILNLGKHRIRPYAYAGFMLGISPQIIDRQKTMSTGRATDTKYVYYGGSVYGLSSGIGVKFYPGKNTKWYFSSEARLISASYGPKKGALVRYYVDGTDVIGTLSTHEKKVIYKDKYTVDDAAPENPDEPAIYSRRFYPFSSLGLNLGVYYIL